MHRFLPAGTATVLFAAALPALADATQAHCDIYASGQDHVQRSVPCTFSQRQGHITIRHDDGVSYELAPKDDTPGNYRDQHGNTVYRQSGPGPAGLIFRLPGERIYVRWPLPSVDPDEQHHRTAPHPDGEGAVGGH